jgi:hypothetical protein
VHLASGEHQAYLSAEGIHDGMNFRGQILLDCDPCNDLHPLFCACGVLMSSHRRRVDHLDLAIIGLRDCIHQPIPNVRFTPFKKIDQFAFDGDGDQGWRPEDPQRAAQELDGLAAAMRPPRAVAVTVELFQPVTQGADGSADIDDRLPVNPALPLAVVEIFDRNAAAARIRMARERDDIDSRGTVIDGFAPRDRPARFEANLL